MQGVCIRRGGTRVSLRAGLRTGMVVSAALVFAAVVTAFFIPLGVAVAPIVTEGVSAPTFRVLAKTAAFTVIQAFLSAAGASAIGFCAAFFCARREFWGRRLLLSLSAIPLSVPPVVIALAFILFFGKNGALNRFLLHVSAGKVSLGTFLYSPVGVLLVHAFYNFPITMRTVAAAWAQLPEETEQAAYLLGASPFRVMKTVIFPALWAPFFSSFVIIFLYSFFSFIIILLLGGLGVSTLEVMLYQTIRRDVHAGAAAWIAVLETGIAAAAVMTYAYLRSKSPDHIENTQYVRPRPRIGGAAERAFFLALISVIVFCLAAPLGSLLSYSLSPLSGSAVSRAAVPSGASAASSAGTAFGFLQAISADAWGQLFRRPAFWTAAWHTVQIGIGTAGLSVITALFFAYLVFQSTPARYKSLPLIPFAVSSIIIGSGWLRLNAPPLPLMLIVMQSSLAWPFAWAQIEIGLAKIPHSVADAARLLSASRSDAFFRVFLPLCGAGSAAAFCFVFAISAGDASLPLLLHIPNFENLALMLFRFAGSYRFTESACIAVILAVLTGSLFFFQDMIKEHIC